MAGKKSGKGERITQRGDTIDEEWRAGVLVSSSKNKQKSEVIVRLKNDRENFSLEESEAEEDAKEEKKIERIAETFLKQSSDEEKSKAYLSQAPSQQTGGELENASMVYFKKDVADFCRAIGEGRVKRWSVEQVGRFLEAFGFSNLVGTFRSNKMDGEALLKLKDRDYEELGILQLKDRIMMRDLLTKLNSYDKNERRKRGKPRYVLNGAPFLGQDRLEAGESAERGREVGDGELRDFESDKEMVGSSQKSPEKGSKGQESSPARFSHFKETEVGVRNAKNILESSRGAVMINNKRYVGVKAKSPDACKGNTWFDYDDVIIEESELNKTDLSSAYQRSGRVANLIIRHCETQPEGRMEVDSLVMKRSKTGFTGKSNKVSDRESSVRTLIDTFGELSDGEEGTAKVFGIGGSQMTVPLDNDTEHSPARRKSSASELLEGVRKRASDQGALAKCSPLHKFRKHLSDKSHLNRVGIIISRVSHSDSLLAMRTAGLRDGLGGPDDLPSPHLLRSHSFNDVNDATNVDKFAEMKNASLVAVFAQDEEGKDNFSSDDSNSKSSSSGSGAVSPDATKRHRKTNLDFDISEEIGPELKSFLVEPNDIQLISEIGKGLNTTVWKGVYQHTDVAIKRFAINRVPGGRKKFLEEAEILSSLRSTYIVLFMGLCIRHPQYYILTEYMEDGSLAQILYERGRKTRAEILSNWAVKLKVIESIAHGMNYLHKMNVLHCDLKPSNILVR